MPPYFRREIGLVLDQNCEFGLFEPEHLGVGIEILGAEADSETWDQVLCELPQSIQDIYFTSNYHLIYERNDEGIGRAFVYRRDGQILFHPFMMRPIPQDYAQVINEDWWDLETVYGYGGPLCTTTDSSFISQAWQAFRGWCGEQRVVAEFVRFNPLVENYKFADASIQLRLDRQTVAVRLDLPEEQLWADYPAGQRTKVRKALAEGLIAHETPLPDGLEAFKKLYQETMARVGSQPYYYFSDAYFDQLCSSLGDNLKLFSVLDDHRTVAAGLFMVHGQRIHYHLGASDANFRGPRPNNLLFHTVAEWGRKRGFHWLHLGGGNTSRSDDSLFRFKASISRDRLSYYLGTRVLNQKVYEALCSEWMRRKGIEDRPNYFLLYRLPVGEGVASQTS